jgi:hypothetical protein
MPEAAAVPMAESLLVDGAVTGAGMSAGLGAAELGGMAGGLGGLGSVGSLFGGAGAGLGASGLGGIASLSSLPVATAMEASPLAMGQISSALAPAAVGTGSSLAGYGLGGAGAGTALGTGAELGGAAISPEIQALQQQLAASQMPQVTELGQVAADELTPEMLQQTQNEAIQKAIADNVAKTGTGAFSDAMASSDPLAAKWFPGGSGQALQAGTSALEGGGVNPITGAPITPGGGIGDLVGQGINWIKENPKTALGAAAAYKLLNSDKTTAPGHEKYSGPLSKFHYDSSKYTPYIQQPPANPYKAQYTSYAKGGIADLGGYSDGGQMLKGPGDGMSDSIPATIANKQPARLANDEFVVPADVVSHLGNGSSDAGAKQLYSMMNRVRKARTGNTKQGRQINPSKYMPA